MCIPFLPSHTAYKSRFTNNFKKKMPKRNVYSVSHFPHGLQKPFHKQLEKKNKASVFRFTILEVHS